jgi:hypothetical protein
MKLTVPRNTHSQQQIYRPNIVAKSSDVDNYHSGLQLL